MSFFGCLWEEELASIELIIDQDFENIWRAQIQ